MISEQAAWIQWARARASLITSEDSELRRGILQGVRLLEEFEQRMTLINAIYALDERLKTVELGKDFEKRLEVLEAAKHPQVHLEMEIQRVLKDYGIVRS